MSNIDTRKAGGGQTVSYASVRLESEPLLPEQLIDMLIGSQQRRIRRRRRARRMQRHGVAVAVGQRPADA